MVPPHPPTPAPPHFGQSSTDKPAVVFPTADSQPGIPVPSGSSVASDAEEIMTPPLPQRPGGPTPDAQPTPPTDETAPATGTPLPGQDRVGPPDFPPPPLGPLAQDARSYEYGFPPPTGFGYPEAERTVASGPPPYGSPLPEAERTVTDDPYRPPAPYGGLGAQRPATAKPPYGDFGNDVADPTAEHRTSPGAATAGSPLPPHGTGAYGPASIGFPPYSPVSPATEHGTNGRHGLPAEHGPYGTGPETPVFPPRDPATPAAEPGVNGTATGGNSLPGEDAAFGLGSSGGAPPFPPYAPADPGVESGPAAKAGHGSPPYGAADSTAEHGPRSGGEAPSTPADAFSSADAGQATPEGSLSGPPPSPGMPVPEAGGQTVTFEDAGGQRTLAIVRVGGDNGPTSSTPGPALTPDAILPPGTPPQAPPEPPSDLGATSTGPIPRLGAGPGFPGGPGMRPPHSGDHEGPSGARRALLVGGGLLAALVLGGGGALAVTELSGGSAKEHPAVHALPPPPTHAAPTPTPTPKRTRARHKPKHVPVDIRDEKKDPRPLTITEVFPSSTVTLAGTKFSWVKTVINDHCSLAANGKFAAELTRQHCRRVVRATFLSSDKKIAVTAGIAVMPTDAAAKAALTAQDPAHYVWFRGMKATGAPKIDKAGGYATSTLRGRYISYAYAMYADAHKPAAKDNTLKTVSGAFRDATARPIERRARQ